MSHFADKPSKPVPDNGSPPPASDLPPAHPRGNLAITLIMASIVAALVAAVTVFGIQAFMGSTSRHRTFAQQGKVKVSTDETVQVFYPVPYGAPPNLAVTGFNRDWVVIVEQKADHFKVRRTGRTLIAELEWKAEGIPADPNKQPPAENPPPRKAAEPPGKKAE